MNLCLTLVPIDKPICWKMLLSMIINDAFSVTWRQYDWDSHVHPKRVMIINAAFSVTWRQYDWDSQVLSQMRVMIINPFISTWNFII